MIAFLRGQFLQKTASSVWIDVQGVGYDVQISLHTYTHIQHLDKGTLFTHLQIREDGQTLYGFADLREKEMFLHLIGISGVGAATARMMLSALRPEEVARAILQGDSKLLEGVKGIGKKTAERIILELKDKMAKGGWDANISPLIHNSLEQDALNALMALGIPRAGAEQAIKKVLKSEASPERVEDIIKQALKNL